MFENTHQAADYIIPWLHMTEMQVLDKFAQLPNSERWFQKQDFQSVYIPGFRKDKVLLIAHVDSVWNDSPKLKAEYNGDGMIFSASKVRGLNEHGLPGYEGVGIAADDRAGIALLWLFKDLGHSLLITGDEETGCIGSLAITGSKKKMDKINEHRFAVEFDRNGRKDLVFYQVGTKPFIDYCCNSMPKYERAEGTSSDISYLCEKICGVNISVGYKNEHRISEVLNLRWWLRTCNTAYNWLSDNKEFPLFLHK